MQRFFSLTALGFVVLLAAPACRDLLTEAPPATEVFDAPLDGLTRAELAAFVRGDAEFARAFSPTAGLGPIFNNTSCAACHSGDGRGDLSNILERVGTPADDFLRAIGGPQIQTQAIPGATAERTPNGVAVSRRLPPPVFGSGLIEAIPAAHILANADPTDKDGDGVSGRANLVTPAAYLPLGTIGAGVGPQLGRFGRKAQVSSLIEQTVTAYHEDMGITSPQLPTENVNPLARASASADRAPDPEVPHAVVQDVVHYIRALAPPAPGPETPARVEGRALFAQVKCGACHVTSFTTGVSPLSALNARKVELYSDLLLHDMGPELADNRGDGGASGSEWRTAPLWGLRLMRRFLDGEGFLLHDGRARSVDEAIRLHGGEASAARDAFLRLTNAQRSALLDFVESR